MILFYDSCSQEQYHPNRHGCAKGILSALRSQPFIHSRWWFPHTWGIGQVSVPPWQGWLSLQQLLPMERNGRVYRYVLLVPAVHDVARCWTIRDPWEVSRHWAMVEPGRQLSGRFVEWPVKEEKTEVDIRPESFFLKKKKPANLKMKMIGIFLALTDRWKYFIQSACVCLN